ncbi:MAG: DUF3810 domain-containing protein [Clostridia bacterium]|nr:DUF3810 domain-containing protein [Clostridia bacterium]
MLKKICDKLLLRPFFFAFLLLGALSLAVHLTASASPGFAEWIGKGISPFLRSLLAHLSAIIPFSIGEALIALLPLWIFVLILVARAVSRDRLRAARLFSAILSVPLAVYTVFVFSFGVLYYAPALPERLDLPQKQITAEELYDVASFLATRAEEEAEAADVRVLSGGSQMTGSYRQMNGALLSSYARLSEKYDFIHHFPIATKPVFFSDAMAYTHIVGVYTFFTGEANVCTALSDFSTVYTAAHEMAHARGIAREDEANFIAFLACTEADDPYIRYAGYMNLLQYVGNALYATDEEAYRTLWKSVYSERIKSELISYNEVMERYAGSFASDVADRVNNAYLEGMGTQGSVSYDLVVTLAVCYLQAEK